MECTWKNAWTSNVHSSGQSTWWHSCAQNSMATIMSWRCSLCKFYEKARDKASLQILALCRVNAHALHSITSLHSRLHARISCKGCPVRHRFEKPPRQAACLENTSGCSWCIPFFLLVHFQSAWLKLQPLWCSYDAGKACRVKGDAFHLIVG